MFVALYSTWLDFPSNFSTDVQPPPALECFGMDKNSSVWKGHLEHEHLLYKG